MVGRGSEIAAAARREQAMDLRSAGATYRQIAETLRISHTTARKYVDAGLRDARRELQDKAQQLIALEYRRLESPMLALAPRVKNGDPIAIACWIKLSESRRRLLGLDSPDRVMVDQRVAAADNFEQEILRDPVKRRLFDQLCGVPARLPYAKPETKDELG